MISLLILGALFIFLVGGVFKISAFAIKIVLAILSGIFGIILFILCIPLGIILIFIAPVILIGIIACIIKCIRSIVF